MRNLKSAWLWILALSAALWLGYADFRSDDTGITAGFLLLFAAGFSFAQPQRPWRWGLFWGFSIPITETLFLAFGMKPRYPVSVVVSLLALLPAFLGAYAGAGLHHFVFSSRPDDPAAPGG
jgi:predicted cobalt transporter CbtA